jgi:hypothetical protein
MMDGPPSSNIFPCKNAWHIVWRGPGSKQGVCSIQTYMLTLPHYEVSTHGNIEEK